MWVISADANEDDLFSERDWADIHDLLAGESCGRATSLPADPDVAVVPVLNELRAYVNTEIVSADLIRNRLLDVWGAVRRFDPDAAKPVEFLLSALVGRDLVHKDEINAICDEVIAALGRARPRNWLIGSE